MRFSNRKKLTLQLRSKLLVRSHFIYFFFFFNFSLPYFVFDLVIVLCGSKSLLLDYEWVCRVMKENFYGHLANMEAMRNISITDTEFAAMIALTLFSEGIYLQTSWQFFYRIFMRQLAKIFCYLTAVSRYRRHHTWNNAENSYNARTNLPRITLLLYWRTWGA